MPRAFYSKIRIFKVIGAPQYDLEHFSKKYKGCLGVTSKCFCTQASVIRKIEILKIISTQCFFTPKSEFSRSLENLKMTLNISEKNIGVSWYQL